MKKYRNSWSRIAASLSVGLASPLAWADGHSSVPTTSVSDESKSSNYISRFELSGGSLIESFRGEPSRKAAFGTMTIRNDGRNAADKDP